MFRYRGNPDCDCPDAAADWSTGTFCDQISNAIGWVKDCVGCETLSPEVLADAISAWLPSCELAINCLGDNSDPSCLDCCNIYQDLLFDGEAIDRELIEEALVIAGLSDCAEIEDEEQPENCPGEEPGLRGAAALPNCDDDCDDLETDDSVNYSSGQKSEAVVDLRVALPGGDYHFVRNYTSAESIPGQFDEMNGWLGDSWHISSLPFLKQGPIATKTDAPLFLAVVMGGRSTTTFSLPVGFDTATAILPFRYSANGGTGDWIEVADIDGVGNLDVRRFIEGVGEQVFEQQGAYLVLDYEIDLYGNETHYGWTTIGGKPRPNRIYLDGTPLGSGGDEADTVLDLSWSTDGTIVDVNGSPMTALLLKAEVYRGTPLTADKITKAVEYSYAALDGSQVFGVLEPDGTFTGGAAHADVGSAGDLIQVVSGARVNTPVASGQSTVQQYARAVTQYRYYPGLGTYTLDGFQLEGVPRRLKSVIPAEQIEFVAQEAKSVGGATPDQTTVVAYAASILAEADNSALLGGSSNLRSPAELASKLIGYDPTSTIRNAPVSTQYLRGDCACTGSTAASRRLDYTYFSWVGDWNGRAVPGRTLMMVESDPDSGSSLRTSYVDLMRLDGSPTGAPYVVNRATLTPQGYLVTRSEYDDDDSDMNKPYKLEAKLWPSAMTRYEPAAQNQAPVYEAAGAGYVEQYVYDEFGFKTETWVTSSYEPSVNLLDHAAAGVALIEARSYADAGGVRRLASISRYQDATSLAADAVEATMFGYGFPAGATAPMPVAYVATTSEAELSTENGTGGDYVSYDFFDDATGNLIWSRAADGGMTNRQYDGETGALTRTVRFTVRPAIAGPGGIYAAFDPGSYSVPNWASDALWNSGGAPADYDRIDHLVDDQGRSVGTSHFGMGATTSADTYIIRDLAEDPLRPGILYPRAVVLPDLIDRVGAGTPYNPDDPTDFAGPASVTWMNASGSVTRRSDYELDPALAHATYGVAGDPAPFTFGPEIAREAMTHDLHGVVLEAHRWPHLDIDVDGDGTLDGASKEDAYTTKYEYDNLGYLIKTEHANGTIVGQVRDNIGRVLERNIATTNEPTPVTAAIYEYDNGLEGDSNVTSITRPVDNQPASDRVTTMQYDVRNRLIGVVRPDDSDQAFLYDNLDRVVEEALYETLPAIADDVTLLASGTDRGFYRSCEYGQRGLKTREFRLINPLDTTLLTKSLVTNYWYDGVGRLAATRAPDSATEMTIFDGLGRITRAASVAEVPVSHSSATGVLAGSERVLEQVDFSFDQRNRIETSTALYRLHSDTTTGAFLTHSGAVPDYGWSFYDDANRLIATVELGTNNAGFIKGGALPARPTDLEDLDPSSAASLEDAVDEIIGQGGDWLAAIYKHNSRGLVEDLIRPHDALVSDPLDAKTFITRTFYDDLSRPIATVENAESVTDSSLVWRAATGSVVGRWQLSLASAPASDTDRVTSFVYDGSDNMTIRTAHTAAGSGPSATGEEAQVTRYVFGTSTTNAPPSLSSPRGSWIASNDLLAMTIYPDETTGEPGATLAEVAASQNLEYVFQNGYNKQGELVGVTDQNQTKRTLMRDKAGRLLRDTLNLPGTNVDSRVVHRDFVYDGMGRLETAESLSLTNNVLNSVGFEYTGLWSVSTLTQNHDGAVTDPGSEKVVYRYPATADASASNTDRVLAVQYPSDASLPTLVDTVTYGYGSVGSISDLLGRVETITNLGKQLASYTHAGASLPVFVDYSDINVALALDLEPTTGAASAAGYPSLDRHGRTVNHAWISYPASDDPSDAMRTVYPGSGAARKYSYDLLSNRLAKLDGRDSHIEDRDWWFDYDGLNRLTQARTGLNEPAGTPTAAPGSRDWTLDVLGNWERVKTDVDGDWVFGGGAGQTVTIDSRNHDRANEIETLTVNTLSGGIPQFDPAKTFEYDDNGNLVADATRGLFDNVDPLVLEYDAWNRVVSASREIDALGQTYKLGEYEYNALHWRTRRLADTSIGLPSGARDQERLYYWSADWQLLEERIGTDTSNPLDGTFDEFYGSHQFWGKRYLDDAIAKRIDRANDGFDVADSLLFYLTDAQFSPIALIEANHATRPIGAIERLDFSPYGTARHRNAMDTVDTSATPPLNFPDGILGLADLNFFVADHQSSPSEPETDIAIPFGLWDLADITASSRFSDGYVAPVDGWLTDPSKGTGISTDNSIGFTGHIFDFETGLYSARRRHYSPELGRWLQRDPAGYVDGMSRYLYAAASPANFYDPLGLWVPDDLISQISSTIQLKINEGASRVQQRFGFGAGVAAHGAGVVANDAVGAVAGIAELGLAMQDPANSLGARIAVEKIRDPLSPSSTLQQLKAGATFASIDYLQRVGDGDLDAIGAAFRTVGYAGLSELAAARLLGSSASLTGRGVCKLTGFTDDQATMLEAGLRELLEAGYDTDLFTELRHADGMPDYMRAMSLENGAAIGDRAFDSQAMLTHVLEEELRHVMQHTYGQTRQGFARGTAQQLEEAADADRVFPLPR